MKEVARVDDVGCAARMHENLEIGIFFQEGAGGTRMIEVDVSEKDGLKIGEAEALQGKLLAESCKGR